MLKTELPKALPAGSEIRTIECRVAFCRVETSHASEAAFQEFMTRAFARRSSSGLSTGPVFAGGVGEHAPGSPLVTVAYVAERGAELPMREVH